MIMLLLLVIISIIAIFIALSILSIGGGLFVVIFADIIVAVGILWLIASLFKKKKG